MHLDQWTSRVPSYLSWIYQDRKGCPGNVIIKKREMEKDAHIEMNQKWKSGDISVLMVYFAWI